jgi:HrpA-like RNA helicase
MDGCFLPLYSKRVESAFSKESYSKLVTEDCTRFILSVLAGAGGSTMTFQDLVFMDLRQRIPLQNITNALRCLYHWGLIDQDMQVTQIGRMIDGLPRVSTEVGTFILHMLQYTNIHFDDILILGAFLENPKMLFNLTKLDYNKGDFEFVGMKKTYSKEIGNPMFDFMCGFITIDDLWVADILGDSQVSKKQGVLDTILRDLRLDRRSFGNFLALVALLRDNFYKIGASIRAENKRVRFSSLSSIQCVSYFNQVNQVIKGLSTRDEFHYNPGREKWVCTSTGMEIYLPASEAKRIYLPSYIVMGNGRTKKYDIMTDLIIRM